MNSNDMRSILRRWMASRAGSIVVLAATWMFTAVTTTYVARTTEANDRRRFENDLHHISDAIQERVSIHLALLRGAAALVTTDPELTEHAFSDYVDQLGLETQYRGVEGVGFARCVRFQDVQSYTDRMRAEVGPQFNIHPAGDRPEYFPVTYLAPEDFDDAYVRGFDIFSEATRSRAMTNARDSGKAATSAKLVLMQEGAETERAGFVVYVPIFRDGRVPNDLEARRQQLLGFVFGGFRSVELFSGIFQSEVAPPVHFEVYDGLTARPDTLLHSSAARPSPKPMLAASQRMAVPGHYWTLKFMTTPNFEVASSSKWTYWIFGAGLVSGLILFGATEAFGRTQRRAAQELALANASLEQRVVERTARLEESMADLEHFSYSITHDMRAPLRAMQGYAHLLLQEAKTDGAARQEYLRRISVAAERMDRLIVDSLNYSKVVRGQMDLEPVQPEKLLREMLLSYPAFQPPQAEIEIRGEFPDVLANESGLTQCFSTFIGNAVKFVEPGRLPHVRIWAEMRDDCVRICFEDNGIGIPSEWQHRVFDMFQRLHRKDYEGTGIGLALVRKIATRMNGRVGVDSEPGNGSTFWLELQAAPAVKLKVNV